MTKHRQKDGAPLPQGGLSDEVRALRSKLAKLERATTESEGISEAYRSLVEDSPQGLAIIQDGRIVFANQKMAFITGYSVNQLKAMSPEQIEALVHPEDRQAVWSRHRDRLEGKPLKDPYEFRGMHKDGHVRWLQLYASRIAYHGRAAVQGAYVDVTAYKQAMHALEESEKRFRLFYECSPLGYQSLDPEGCFLQVNPAWLEMFGYDREEVIGRSFSDFVAPAMRQEFSERFEHFKRSGQVTTAQWEMVRKDGRLIIVELDGKAVFNTEGDFDHSHCVIRDVTAREKALRALRESEERYRTLVEGAPVSILVLQDGRYVYANPVGARKLGYDNPTDIVGKEPLEAIDPDYHAAIRDRVRTSTRGARNAPMELKVITKDGTVRWMESTSLPITRDGRSATLIVGQDITERKETEVALKESEDQLKRAQQVAHVGSWSMDFDSLGLTWSDQTYRIFGLPIGTPLTERDFLDCIHPDDFDNQRRAWAAALQGAPYDVEHRIISNGKSRWVRERAALEFSDAGKPLRAIGTVQDITERKQAMMALRESEQMYRTLIEGLPDIVMRFDREGRHQFVSDNVAEVVDISPGQFIGKTHRQLGFPDAMCDLWERAIRRVFDGGKPHESEFSFEGKRGPMIFNWRLVPEMDAERKTRAVLSFSRDVTAHREAEQALAASERRFRETLEHVQMIAVEVDAKGRVVFANDFLLQLTERTRTETTGCDWFDLFIPEQDRAVLRAVHAENLREGGQFLQYENPILTAEGEIRRIRWTNTVHRDRNGASVGILSLGEDVTAREQAQEALRQSDEKYRLLFDEMLSGMALHEIILDESGVPVDYRFLSVNTAFEAMTGLKGQDVEGRTAREVMPVIESVWIERYGRVALTGEPTQFEQYSEALKRHYEVRAYCPKPLQFAVVFHDITERRAASQALRASQEKLATIFHSAPAKMLVVNEERRVVNANRAALEATGYSAEQIEGLRGGDAVRCVHALDAPEGCGFGPFCEQCTIRQLVVETLEDGISHHNAEARLCVMAGEQTDERIFQTSTSRIDTLTERLALICLEDITDRRRAEEALRRERDRAQGYLDTVESIVVALNEEGRITLINKKGCRLFGCREEELVGRFWFAECLPQPEGIDKVYPRFLELIAGKVETLEYFENPIIDRTGKVRQIAWHNALLRDDEGRIIGTLSSGDDITERKRAEQAMRESEERHRLLFENASVGIGYFDPNGRVIAFNAIAGTWMGGDPKSFVGKSLVEMYGQEAGPEYQRRIESALHSGTAQVYEDRVVLPAGELWLMSTYTRITNTTGEIVGVQIISADITDRKQAEMALQESEDKYRRLFSEMSSGCALHEIICDADGTPTDYRTLEVNKTFEALLETPSENVVGKRASDILSEEELRKWLDIFGSVALTGESCYYEMYSQANDKWFEGNAFCPEPGKFAVTFSDVTRRKQAEIDLEAHRAELEAIYEHTPALLCVLDEDRRVLYANRAFTDFTGVPESALKAGRACGVFGCVNATSDSRGCGYGRQCQDCRLYQALEDTLRTGISHRDIEYRATLERHGSRREVVLLGATALVRTSDRSNLLLCLQDVTEQKQAQERSKQRETELLHVSRLSTLGEMVSGFSHELNQPLSAVLNYGTACIRLLGSDQPDVQRVARNLTRIVGQAERARDIMGRIRALAQRRQPDLTSVDLNQAIANVVDLLSWETRRKEIDVNLDLDEQLPPVRADVIQIEQVLLNLIRNGIDALEQTAPGQRHLTLRTRIDESRIVCAEVRDTGVGLPKGVEDRIFEAFFTTKSHGLGIGLSISRTIMEMHGGTLEARENEGRGCTFVVSFPTIPVTEPSG